MTTVIHPRAFLLIALTTVLLITGAAAQKPKPAAVDYFPLRVGDSWRYQDKSGGREMTRKVLSEEKQADGTTRYLVETSTGSRMQAVYSKVSGWVLLHTNRYPDQERAEPTYEPAKRYLPDPLVAGLKWQEKGKDPTQPEVQENSQVIAAETITVPAGQFRTIKVVTRFTGRSPAMTHTRWYADGIGLVKESIEAGSVHDTKELIECSFKKKDKDKPK